MNPSLSILQNRRDHSVKKAIVSMAILIAVLVLVMPQVACADSDQGVVIAAPEGSYAISWAKANGFAYLDE